MFYRSTQNRRKHWYHVLSIEKKLLWIPVMLCIFLLTACIAVLLVYTVRAREYDMKQVAQNLPGSILYDRASRVVTPLSARDNAPVTWSELPQHLIQAFIAREDDHFFDHHGVVYTALLRSAFHNLLSMSYKQGASTITMQLTRHVYELQGKTIDRKLLEIVLAQRIENEYDKQTILCQYLSRIYFGQNCYGLREAAHFYFGKKISELTLAESALLAGIVRAPSLYNPVRSPESAIKARHETLARMRELDMISSEQLAQAEAVTVTNKPAGTQGSTAANKNYPAMWANAELDSLNLTQNERSRGLTVLSSLHLPLQQYTERALAAAIQAVETSSAPLPEEWKSLPHAEPNELQPKLFASTKRPAALRRGPRSSLAVGELRLQTTVLIVDSRLNSRGNVLAIACGRDATDSVNRWDAVIQPGRVAAPLIFCCACLPGENSHHIVSHSARVTGSRLGYNLVHNFIDSLNLGTLPDKEHESDLYDGLFPVRMVDLARALFSIQNMGLDYRLRLINTIWSQGHHLIYAEENKKAKEYIRREGAVAVSHLPPFRYREGTPIVLHEELPDNRGQWTMVSNDRGVAVFVWMGVENSSGTCKTPPELRRLVAQASLALARQLHARARAELRAETSVNRK